MSIAFVETRERSYNKKKFSDIVNIIERLSKNNKDCYTTITNDTMKLYANNDIFVVKDDNNKKHELQMTRDGFSLLCSKLGIPANFILKLSPGLIDDIFEERINKNHGKRVLVRTKDYEVLRSIHSDKYGVYDNKDFIRMLEPVSDKLEFLRTHITDSSLYLKTTTPRTVDEYKIGCVFSNNEIGMGCVRVAPYIHRLPCTNDLVYLESSFKKMHKGNINSYIEHKLDDIINDIIGQSDKRLRHLEDLKEIEIVYPRQTINNLCSTYHIRQKSDLIYKHYQNEPEPNAFGIINAITSAARFSNGRIDNRLRLESLAALLTTKNLKEFDYEQN